MILDSEAEVRKMNLVYFPILKNGNILNMIPAWEVRINIQDAETNHYFDAVTGEEIVK